MSLLNSKFDIVSVDNPLALAAIAQVLESSTGMALNDNGTPVVGNLPPGAIVSMTDTGKAQLASAMNEDEDAPVAGKQLVFVTLDGDRDYSGAFVKKITVLHGGFTMVTDQFDDAIGSYTPGTPVTFQAGKVRLVPQGVDAQIVGFVGPQGADISANTVQIIVPQGCGI